MDEALKSNVPSGYIIYRKTHKTNKDRLHRALLPYAVGLFRSQKVIWTYGRTYGNISCYKEVNLCEAYWKNCGTGTFAQAAVAERERERSRN
jgi:hypothetical protein